jgi:hypothetical protein
VARIHGKNGKILMSTSGSTEPVIVLAMAEFSYDAEPDRVDVTSFGDSNKQSVQGFPGAKGSFAGYYDSSASTLWTAAASATGTILMFYPDYTDTSHYFRCPAWVSASIASRSTDAVKVSGTWEANGAVVNAL